MANTVLDWSEEKQEKVMRQYETVRKSGVTNMFDRTRVRWVARKLKFVELVEAASDMDLYVSILTNFSDLMKKYDVKQV